MNALFEIIPLIIFLISYKLQGIYIATALLMIFTIIQHMWIYYKHKKLTTMQIVTLVLILIFGMATILFRDERFIKIKPTVLYWLFAVALEVSWRKYKVNLLQKFLDPVLQNAEIKINNQKIWEKTHYLTTAFFWTLGLINIVVAYNYSLDTWVKVKVFFLPAISFIAIISLFIWLKRYNENSKN